MLARSFLSAADLRISEIERDALIATLHAFEREEIVSFSMRNFREDCGTPACICGWANHLSEGRAFAEVSSMSGTLAVKRLYGRLPKLNCSISSTSRVCRSRPAPRRRRPRRRCPIT